MARPKLATLWLDGCSGCHMSLLDTDERLLELADRFDIVASPLLDCKHFPQEVDAALIEGAVGSSEDERRLRQARQRSRLVIALGDCAVTGNVPALRNPFGADPVLKTIFCQGDLINPQIPSMDLPPLTPMALPLHALVKVDLFLPGCPPPAEVLFTALSALAAGRLDQLSLTTGFGA